MIGIIALRLTYTKVELVTADALGIFEKKISACGIQFKYSEK